MDDLLISGIQHFVFCPRQWALIHVEQQWRSNYLTTHGKILHERADKPLIMNKRNDVISLHAVEVRSNRLRIQGICDVVELQRNDKGVFFSKWGDKYIVVPIEYKRGKPKSDNSDVLQLLAQSICLEEMTGTIIPAGYIFYHQLRRREYVEFTDELRYTLERCIDQMHQYIDRNYTPKARESKKCNSCSLRDLCLPELAKTMSVENYIEKMTQD